MGKNKVNTDRLGQAPLVGSAPRRMITQFMSAVKCQQPGPAILNLGVGSTRQELEGADLVRLS